MSNHTNEIKELEQYIAETEAEIDDIIIEISRLCVRKDYLFERDNPEFDPLLCVEVDE